MLTVRLSYQWRLAATFVCRWRRVLETGYEMQAVILEECGGEKVLLRQL
jgi:hypothetical protein